MILLRPLKVALVMLTLLAVSCNEKAKSIVEHDDLSVSLPKEFQKLYPSAISPLDEPPSLGLTLGPTGDINERERISFLVSHLPESEFQTLAKWVKRLMIQKGFKIVSITYVVPDMTSVDPDTFSSGFRLIRYYQDGRIKDFGYSDDYIHWSKIPAFKEQIEQDVAPDGE